MTVATRRWALAALSGLSLYVSHPPVGLWPASFLVVPLLLAAVLDAERPRQAAVAGLVAGAVGYAPMISWIVLPAGYAAWALLTSTQAVAVALAAAVSHRWARSPWIVAVAPLVWTGMEVWRNSVPLGGFGWGELAYAQVDSGWMLPLARLGGARLLTLVTVLVGTLLYDAYRRGRLATAGLEGPVRDRLAAGLPHAQPALLGLAGVLVLVAVAAPEAPPTGGTLDVVAVQGNDMRVSTLPAAEEDRVIAANLRDETLAALAAGPADLVVWPESGVDRDPFTEAGRDLAPILDEAAAAAGRLVTGAILDGPRPGTFRNAAVVVDDAGEERDRYVKRHLVPFGEFVPWRDVLGRIPALDQVPRDGVAGTGPATLTVDGVDLAVAICFETLFPRLVRDNVLGDGEPAGLLLATTNDASFGDSPELPQHLAQSRLRAVETGRWVVHASLTGGAAFVDPDGRAHDVTSVFATGAIRREVPIATGLTPFLRVGDVTGLVSQLVAMALLLVAVAVAWRDRRRADTATDTTAVPPRRSRA